MGTAAWNPVIHFIGGADEDLWKRAVAIVAAVELEHSVTDLEAGSWRVFEFDTPTQDAAVVALERVLDGIPDPEWRDVLRVAWE